MAAGYGHTQHGHRGFGGQHTRQMRRAARARNNGLQAARLRCFGIAEQLIGHAVGGDHTRLVRHAKVLQNLLTEGVPVRDMRTLLQTLVEYAPRSQDPDVLTAACRIALRRLIVQDIVGGEPVIPVITLAPDLERILHQSLQAGGAEGAGIEPGLAERMQRSLTEATQRQALEGQPAISLTSGL